MYIIDHHCTATLFMLTSICACAHGFCVFNYTCMVDSYDDVCLWTWRSWMIVCLSKTHKLIWIITISYRKLEKCLYVLHHVYTYWFHLTCKSVFLFRNSKLSNLFGLFSIFCWNKKSHCLHSSVYCSKSYSHKNESCTFIGLWLCGNHLLSWSIH